MKKFVFVFLIFVITCTKCTVLAHERPDDIVLADYCGIVSQGVKDYVNTKNKLLYDKTEAKIIYIISNKTDINNAADEAKALYSRWNIGKLGRGNSVLVLICPAIDDYALIQANNIKRALTDDILYETICEHFEPYIEKRDYDSAIVSLYNALGGWYEENYHGLDLSLSSDFDSLKYGEKTILIEKNTDKLWFSIFAFVCFILIIVFFKTKKKIDFKKRQQERQIKRKRSKADIDKIVNS